MIKKFSILLSLIFVFSLSISGERLTPCTKSDDCGKIIGWLYDYDTGMVINEKFAVTFISYINGKPFPYRYYALISDSGYFSISVKQGQYVAAITPRSESSKYPYHFDPYAQPKEDEIITVERGKITEIRKKLQMSGAVKIILTNLNGEKIDIIQKYHISKITFGLKNMDIGYCPSVEINKDKIEADEMIIKNLFPGVYGINAYFPDSGYGPLQGGTFFIESKKTTEYKFIIDIDESTGIHGFIKDKNGIPIKYAEVILIKDIENRGEVAFGKTVADDNGYYKLIGVKEGVYRLRVEGDYYECYYPNIIITKNRLLDKDVVVNCQE